MKTYIEEALSYIESEEMCGRQDWLDIWLCSMVVLYAPAPTVRPDGLRKNP